MSSSAALSTAVARHPDVRMNHTTSGVMMPPTAKPVPDKASALARRRSNQATVAVVMLRKPDKLMPTATTRNAEKKPAGLSMRLRRANPAAITTTPTRITCFGPKRSRAQPWTGPSRPLSALVRE